MKTATRPERTRTDATAPIREPLRHDAKAVRELVRMAHPGMHEEKVLGLGDRVRDEVPDTTTGCFQRTKDGALIEDVPFLHTLRVIAPPTRQARSLLFSAPPLDWIISQGRVSGLTIEDRVQLSGALTECQLLATHPRWRGRGYAARLLAEAEARYGAAGYRAIFVVINPGKEDVAAWYRRRGYAVGEPDTPPMVQFWGDRLHRTGRYDHLIPGQRVGFKALHDQVSVTALSGLVHVRGLIRAADETSAAGEAA